MRTELGDAYVDDLFKLYGGRVPTARRLGDATGSSKRGHRSQPEKRSERDCWRPRPSAAARIAKYWNASKRPATSSGRGATGTGFWRARLYVFRWSGLIAGPSRHVNLMDRRSGRSTPNLTAALDLTAAKRLPENSACRSWATRKAALSTSTPISPRQMLDCAAQPERPAKLRCRAALGQRPGYHRTAARHVDHRFRHEHDRGGRCAVRAAVRVRPKACATGAGKNNRQITTANMVVA